MKKILTVLLLILTIVNPAYSQSTAVYDLGNGYTAVRNDIFDQWVENDELLDVYREEAEYYKKTLEQFMALSDEKGDIQEARIVLLKDTIYLKDEIINYKDSQIENYNQLYQIKSVEANKRVFSNWFSKLLLLGMGAYAVSEIDDTAGRAAVGALTIYLFNN
ncbi:MAG TPA: hypothetical protein PKY72_05350 [Bacilli bacterium]|nr:hypothetical protein [Bacilli bacterium]